VLANRADGAQGSNEAFELYRLPAERLRQLARLAFELAEATLDLPRLIETIEHRFAEMTQSVCELVFPEASSLIGRSSFPPSSGGSLSLPLLCRDRVIATLQLSRSGVQPYTEEEIAFLRAASAYAALALANASSLATSGEAPEASDEAAHGRVVDEAQAKLATIVMASDDAIIGCDLFGSITSWNPGAERMFGYRAHEVLGRSLGLIVPPDRLDELAEKLHAVAGGSVQRFETVRRRRDGRTFDVSVAISPVRDGIGRVIGIAKVARDITEQRRAQAQVLSANAELEAFSYSVAHDLRAPLRGMNGFARLLLEHYGARFDEEGRDWLDEILENSQKMGHLIDALLSLARVARSEVKREPVELSEIAHTIAAQLASEEPRRAVTWQIAPAMSAELDRVLARALLENLLTNAWKFTRNEARARIEFGVERAPGGRTFFVRDNGIGFDMACAGKLFGPFQRLHTSADFPGIGVGLATVQRIVHRHGGRVWAEGSVNGGATFYFFLPEIAY